MKTKVSIILVCLIWMASSMYATVYNGVCGNELSWRLDTNDSIVVITGRGEMSNFQFDEDKRPYVKSVVFPEGITRISPRSFEYCYNLQSVTLPDNVMSIGFYAFRKCTGLKEFHMGKNVRTIELNAFRDCTSLQRLVLSDSLETIGVHAFDGCGAITDTVVFPESLVSLGDNAFAGASGPNAVAVWKARHCKSGAKPMSHFTKVIFGENVEYIGTYLFSNAPLDTVVLPNGVDTIEQRAFYKCSLKYIELPQSLKYIGYSAFDGAASLTSLTVPENVSNIPSTMCYGCSSLKSVTLPEGITTIENYAFYQCKSLSNINIPQSVQSIGDHAFASCSSLISVSIPEGITGISDYAFASCSSLTSVSIPAGITGISDYAFNLCISLKEVHFPNSLTSIGEGAFQDCAIDSLDFPASLVSIGEDAFSRLLNLKELFIPDEVRQIKSGAFEGCTALQKVTFGRKVSMIDTDAFKGDNRLTELTCNAVVPPLAQSSTFSGVPDTATLIVPSQSIEEYAADEVWGRFRIQQNQEPGHVTTETTETAVNFTWPSVEGASYYTLIIWANEERTEKICTLTFNSMGQLIEIDFSRHAPARRAMNTADTFSFRYNGLDENTDYWFTMTASDENDTELFNASGSFATLGANSPTNIDDVQRDDVQCTKFLRNGQLYLMYQGRMYDIQGNRIK